MCVTQTPVPTNTYLSGDQQVSWLLYASRKDVNEAKLTLALGAVQSFRRGGNTGPQHSVDPESRVWGLGSKFGLQEGLYQCGSAS